MVRQGIKIFGRVRPTNKPFPGYNVHTLEDEDDVDGEQNGISFHRPKNMSAGMVNNKKETYKFKFNKIFEREASQELVFSEVAEGVIHSVLDGYNGTIFAYGQTGSGKTFTISGGQERYGDRGIIPRTISYIYSQYAKRPSRTFTTHISFLEIYNESGYDLLDSNGDKEPSGSGFDELPKVTLREDEENNLHLKNLSSHLVDNEEEALDLLFLGETNRMVAETPMNLASSRSHCIFTIYISSRESGSEVIRRSKLHLVDLAGSERVSKTGVDGTLLKEAKYINLSLHYLEQVIIALQEKSEGKRSHVPYRNSMMTSVLRDSLGGNCQTTMIATMSVERPNIDESISTCRFAQRVALIENEATLNEELDPKLVISRLKKEIRLLKDELALATGDDSDKGPLTNAEIKVCEALVDSFINNDDEEAAISLGDMRKIQMCFKIFKLKALNAPPSISNNESEGQPPIEIQEENKRIKELLEQRDNEINILVSMLKKERKKDGKSIDDMPEMRYHSESKYTPPMAANIGVNESLPPMVPNTTNIVQDSHPIAGPQQNQNPTRFGSAGKDKKALFEHFRKNYPHNSAIEENKVLLKQKYSEAKSIGEQVNKSRNNINALKALIEQLRIERAMQGILKRDDNKEDPEEERNKALIEKEKAEYKANFYKLRELKSDIENMQRFLEQSKAKLQKEFEIWYNEQMQEQTFVPNDGGLRAESFGNMSTTTAKTYVVSDTSATDKSNVKASTPPRNQKEAWGTSISNNASKSDIRLFSSSLTELDKTTGRKTQEDMKTTSTGDASIDAEVQAFYKARNSLLKATPR
eukprot:Nk52_evm98s226 gene=Nk52_evmTU98s226